ncbi:response regulator [Roseibacillus ishigakijimensis]|uniref:Response regulator transcription factor n=1 Tax=Roseibacillus ishigakijimensis TaxID=454146 RepID=A0A934VIM2_9BACT|nr:response regulator transcription factor [Roseibacillus ishigakijimensis]MBK1835218.1 response regulator transcription factor [Roseibacillus ishigakijimensis]
MKDSEKHSVAIIEDNSDLGETLRLVIDSSDHLRCAGVWKSAEEGLRKIEAFRPKVVLMDINLPGLSGIEATALLKKHLPDILIITVTVYGEHDKIFAALKAGATGYLLKRAAPDELCQAIHEVLAGGAPMSPEIARRVVDAFYQQRNNRVATANLTPREEEVLALLAEGLANKEIADRLDISAETIRVHNRSIYKKLEVSTRTQAVMKYRDGIRTTAG